MINNKLYLGICMILCIVWACSDKDEQIIIPPELPENDLNISVPPEEDILGDYEYTGNWEAGMDFVPYPGMPRKTLGEEIHVIVCDAEDHGRKIMAVLNNEAWPIGHSLEDKQLKQYFFPPHNDIIYHLTETYDDPNPEYWPCDIISASTSGTILKYVRIGFKRYLNKEKFPAFPLVITSAGNGTNMFTQEAWDLCLEIGSIDWKDIVNYFGWTPDGNGQYTEEQAKWYKCGDVGAAYAIQDPDGLGHKEDFIVVGSLFGTGNKPGPILKDRWVCTYYSWMIEDKKADGTSFSTPYVAKIAAEIKRRAPHYTNNEIAQLIFSTCDDLGAPGCDDVFGWGVINPSNIWAELTKRGY